MEAQVSKIVAGHIDKLRADIEGLPGPSSTHKSRGGVKGQQLEVEKEVVDDEEGGGDGGGPERQQRLAALTSERVGDMIKRQGELEKKTESLLEMMHSLDGSVQGMLNAWQQDEQDKLVRDALHRSVAGPIVKTHDHVHINSDVTTSSDDGVGHQPSRRHRHGRSPVQAASRNLKTASNSSGTGTPRREALRGMEAAVSNRSRTIYVNSRDEAVRASEAAGGAGGVQLQDFGPISNSFVASKTRASKGPGKERRGAAAGSKGAAEALAASGRQVCVAPPLDCCCS